MNLRCPTITICTVLVLISLSTAAFSRSSGSGGIPSTPSDWRCGSISSKLSQQVRKSFPLNERVLGGFDRKQLKTYFENKTVSYCLTVKTDGTISELKVNQTSGSINNDQKGIDIIRAAAPFRRAPQEITGNRTYIVEFPNLSVKDTSL